MWHLGSILLLELTTGSGSSERVLCIMLRMVYMYATSHQDATS
jgi:hypothetical protein